MSVSQNPYAPPTTDVSAQGLQWMRTDMQALSKTALGLSLVYFGIVVLLLSIILSVAAAAVPQVLMLTLGGVILAGIMMFIGPLFCLSVPAATNAKGLIIGSVVFQSINLLFVILPLIGIQLSRFDWVAQLLGVLSAILFVLFMRRLAQFLGRDDLAGRARNVLFLGALVFVVAFAAVISLFVVGPVAGALMFAVMIMGLVLFVMYANLVNALRKALQPTATTSPESGLDDA